MSRTGLAALVVLAISALGMAPASASGDPAIDRYILKNPVPGWFPSPAAVDQVVATTLATTLSTGANEKVTVADDGWGDAATPSPSVLLIILLRFPGNKLPLNATPSAMVSDLCSSANATPGFISPLSGIPDSASESCRSPTDGSITAITWEQANVAAFVYAAGLPVVTVDQVAQDQSAAIPATGIAEPSFPYVLVGAAVLVVAMIVLVVVLRRRRKTSSAAPATGGWPVQAGGQAGWGYATGFEPAGGVPAETPAPSWSASAGLAPWAASGGQQVASALEPGAYAGGPSPQYNKAVVPYGNASGGPAPYAPSRPSQRVASGQVSYGGTQAFPEPGALAFPGPAVAAPPPPVEIGWHPADGDPHRQRYWDGNNWTGRLRWDGSSWVDEA